MISEVIKPQSTSFTIDIPSDYINKHVKLLMYIVDEPQKRQTTNQLRGVFSKYANESKKLHEKSAWQEHLKEKYKTS